MPGVRSSVAIRRRASLPCLPSFLRLRLRHATANEERLQCALFALALLCVLAIDPAAAKDTGLIFVSNEKTQQHHRHRSQDLQGGQGHQGRRGARATCISTPTTPSSTSPAATTTSSTILDVAKLEVIGQAQDRAEPGDIRRSTRRGGASTSPTKRGRRSPSSTWTRTSIVKEVPTGAEPEGVLLSEDGKIALRDLGGRRPRPQGGYRGRRDHRATWSSARGRGGLRRRPTARSFG